MSTPMEEPESLAELANRLLERAALCDTFGPTTDGMLMRLAAAVIVEMETQVMRSIVTMRSLEAAQAELRRVENELARGQQ